MLLLKHLSNFWRTFEMTPVNGKTNLILTWPANCFVAVRIADG